MGAWKQSASQNAICQSFVLLYMSDRLPRGNLTRFWFGVCHPSFKNVCSLYQFSNCGYARPNTNSLILYTMPYLCQVSKWPIYWFFMPKSQNMDIVLYNKIDAVPCTKIMVIDSQWQSPGPEIDIVLLPGIICEIC